MFLRFYLFDIYRLGFLFGFLVNNLSLIHIFAFENIDAVSRTVIVNSSIIYSNFFKQFVFVTTNTTR